MLAIRLKPMGKKGQRTFRIVVSDSRKDLAGPSIETIGTLDPNTNPRTITVNEERAKYWLGKGAAASATVHNLFVERKLIAGDKLKITRAGKPETAETPSGETPAEPKAEPKKPAAA